MKKRILAMLLTVCMVFSMLPMSALAARVDDVPLAALPEGEETHDHDHAHEAARPADATDAAQLAEVTEGAVYTPADAEAAGLVVHYFGVTNGAFANDTTPRTVTLRDTTTQMGLVTEPVANTGYRLFSDDRVISAFYTVSNSWKSAIHEAYTSGKDLSNTGYQFQLISVTDTYTNCYKLRSHTTDWYMTHEIRSAGTNDNRYVLTGTGETFYLTPAGTEGEYYIWYTTEIARVAAKLGTSSAFDGGEVDLSKALYQFSASGANFKITNTIPGTTTNVNFSLATAGKPQVGEAASAAPDITVTYDNDNAYAEMPYRLTSGTTNTLYFHRDPNNAKYLKFDRNGSGIPVHFALFKKDSTSNDGEIPGYTKVTDNPVAAGQYLIAAKADGNWYVLYPSDAGEFNYDHVAKVVPMTVTEDIRDEGINIAADYAGLDITEGVTATAPSAHKINDTAGDGSAEAAVDGDENTQVWQWRKGPCWGNFQPGKIWRKLH